MKTFTVYTITYNGEVKYVGMTSNFKRRKYRHLNGYGSIPEDVDLSSVVLEKAAVYDSKEEALKYEDELILQYGTIEKGWNKQRFGLIAAGREKEYWSEWRPKYYQEHKDEENARNRKWTEEHREERLAYFKAYYQKKKAEKNSQP